MDNAERTDGQRIAIDWGQLERLGASDHVEASHWRQRFHQVQDEVTLACMEWQEMHQAAVDRGDRWRAAWAVALVALALGIGIAVAQRWPG